MHSPGLSGLGRREEGGGRWRRVGVKSPENLDEGQNALGVHANSSR